MACNDLFRFVAEGVEVFPENHRFVHRARRQHLGVRRECHACNGGLVIFPAKGVEWFAIASNFHDVNLLLLASSGDVSAVGAEVASPDFAEMGCIGLKRRLREFAVRHFVKVRLRFFIANTQLAVVRGQCSANRFVVDILSVSDFSIDHYCQFALINERHDQVGFVSRHQPSRVPSHCYCVTELLGLAIRNLEAIIQTNGCE
mmetsp:Transcript_19073/g.34092  ORF Transcript_19073/g.34092 Transcript_19073/m.34092 type:complete len:202 (+) Transcript_19073:165-770(+)